MRNAQWVPKVIFGPRATLSLSLLLHELTTNALKYGALSVDTGTVSITWGIEPGEQEEFVLSWTERRGPPAIKPDRQGFGSRLIEMGLSGTGGSKISYTNEGFEAAFRASLAEIMQS